MIDFGSLRKPDSKTRPTDPREIFKRRPSGEGAANDLWQGQAEALEAWFNSRKDETLILLNTGAGKTIIGLLIAQSYVNQAIKNVVYVCSTIDLVHQTAKEAAKLGLPVTCRYGGEFDNDLFSQGKAFWPDNLWIDTHAKKMIAFELKCDKSAESLLTKDDIGQGHNHLEWLKSQYADLELLGLIFLTDTEAISDKSNPSDKMHVGTQEQLRKLWDDFTANIERVRTKSPLERIAEAGKIGELPEWSMDGILKRLSRKKIG